jgi:hypothetical protein
MCEMRSEGDGTIEEMKIEQKKKKKKRSRPNTSNITAYQDVPQLQHNVRERERE